MLFFKQTGYVYLAIDAYQNVAPLCARSAKKQLFRCALLPFLSEPAMMS